MMSIAHTIISLPFAVYLNNPVLIFLIAFVGHLFSDTLLHWNIFPFQFKKYPYALVALDILAGLVITYFLVDDQFFTLAVWAAIAGGNAPDVLHGFWEMLSPQQQQKYFSWAIPTFSFHNKLQLETPSIAWGLISQLILSGIAIYLVS